MIAVTRPLATATAALMGAGVIAAAPALPAGAPALPRFSAPDIALTSTFFDILTFPAWQQAIANEVEFLAIRTAGLAEAGVGLADSVAQLPETLLTATQQVFSGDALGALTTMETWAIDAGSSTLVPPIAANIEVGQIELAIQSALLLAQPVAAVEFGTGVFTAFDTVARSFIIAGQNFVDAVLSFDLGGIVQAVIDGVTGVLGAFGSGGQAVIDGVVAAQTTLATALATRPVHILPIGVPGAVPKIASAHAAPSADTRSASPTAPDSFPAAAEVDPGMTDPGAKLGGPTPAGARSASGNTAHRSADRSRAGNAEPSERTDAATPAKAESRRAAAR